MRLIQQTNGRRLLLASSNNNHANEDTFASSGFSIFMIRIVESFLLAEGTNHKPGLQWGMIIRKVQTSSDGWSSRVRVDEQQL